MTLHCPQNFQFIFSLFLKFSKGDQIASFGRCDRQGDGEIQKENTGNYDVFGSGQALDFSLYMYTYVSFSGCISS
jgi:hypothetical protein